MNYRFTFQIIAFHAMESNFTFNIVDFFTGLCP